METSTDYMGIDFGVSQEHPTMMQTIEVVIKTGSLVQDYAKAFVDEGFRINYDKANMVQLEVDEMVDYLSYLLAKRVECVYGSCSDFRNLKILQVPAFFQYVMSLVGTCVDRENGLTFVPILEGKSEFTFSDAVRVSEKIASFEDELQLVQDAMPRERTGDLNFMSTALIGNYVAACRKVEHPMTTYVTAFLEMKLKEEANWSVLYRKLYGDKDIIGQVLVAESKKLL